MKNLISRVTSLFVIIYIQHHRKDMFQRWTVLDNQLTQIGLGIFIGLVSVLIGAGISYRLYIHDKDTPEPAFGPLTVMLVISAILVFIGGGALTFGVLQNDLGNMILIGVGVFIGFAVTFFVVLWAWSRRNLP